MAVCTTAFLLHPSFIRAAHYTGTCWCESGCDTYYGEWKWRLAREVDEVGKRESNGDAILQR